MTVRPVFREQAELKLPRKESTSFSKTTFERRDLSEELAEDAVAVEDETPVPPDTQWTPNCLVRRHNSGVERIAGISSCLGFVRKLAITQTSNRLGDIAKIAIFALANVALAIFDVVKGAFTVMKSVVTKVICCGRNTATPPSEETLTEEQLAAQKVEEEEGTSVVTSEEEDGNVALNAVNARLRTQELAMATLSDRFSELARLSGEERLKATETALRDNSAAVNQLRTEMGRLQGGLEGIQREIAPLNELPREIGGLSKEIEGLGGRLGAIDDKATAAYIRSEKLSNKIGLLDSRMHLPPMASHRPSHFSSFDDFDDSHYSSSSSGFAPSSSSSSSSLPAPSSSSSSSSSLPAPSSSSSSATTTSVSSSTSSARTLTRQPTTIERLEHVEDELRNLKTKIPNPAATVVTVTSTVPPVLAGDESASGAVSR